LGVAFVVVSAIAIEQGLTSAARQLASDGQCPWSSTADWRTGQVVASWNAEEVARFPLLQGSGGAHPFGGAGVILPVVSMVLAVLFLVGGARLQRRWPTVLAVACLLVAAVSASQSATGRRDAGTKRRPETLDEYRALRSWWLTENSRLIASVGTGVIGLVAGVLSLPYMRRPSRVLSGAPAEVDGLLEGMRRKDDQELERIAGAEEDYTPAARDAARRVLGERRGMASAAPEPKE